MVTRFLDLRKGESIDVGAVTITLAAIISSTVSVHLLTILQASGMTLAAAVGLGALVGPAQVTARAVVEAIRGVRQHQLPYWDSLIWATAKLAGVSTVLSEDFSDGQLIEGVRFRNPFGETFDQTLLE